MFTFNTLSIPSKISTSIYVIVVNPGFAIHTSYNPYGCVPGAGAIVNSRDGAESV